MIINTCDIDKLRVLGNVTVETGSRDTGNVISTRIVPNVGNGSPSSFKVSHVSERACYYPSRCFACQKRVFQLLHPINQLIAIGKVGWQRAAFAGFASQRYVGPTVTDPSSKYVI